MRFYFISLCFLFSILSAQETRSTINGRIYDPQSGAVGGAKVIVTHTDTNTVVRLTSNETGYYEAPLLMPGNYRISAEAPGFKNAVRDAITLQVGQQLAIDINLEVGSVSETVQVTAETPVLDTGSLEVGALIDNQELMDLPVLGNNPTLLTKLAPGVQSDGVNNYLGLHSIAGGSAYNNAAGVGGNEWSIDGVPNNGGSRQAAYLPYSDTISEFRIDTTGFDVSQRTGTGVSIVAMTKAGTNQYHGTLTEQHWQQRFNGTPYFTRQLYFRNIADAQAQGDAALANQLRNEERQPSGHSNNWAATIGGPVVIPKLYSGKNKLFVFFSYNGFKDSKTEEANQFNKTVPTMANRDGDFTNFLKIDAVKYQLYEPLSVRRDTSRTTGTFYVRDPIPGNVIPKSRILMPKMYKFYSDLYPVPNNDPTDPKQEPRNNYMAVATPWLWNYRAYQDRIDYNATPSHRFFGRWSWNNFDEDRQDWTYSTIRGMNTGGINRKNMAATVDWTWIVNGTTLLNISGAANEFTSGNRKPVPLSFKPTDVGLPKYLDDWAGDQHILPRLAISGYTDPSPSGVPSFTRFRVYSMQGNLSQFRGRHSFKAGADMRQHFRTGGGGGNTSGYFRFDNRYTRRYSDTALYTPGDIGLSWADFMMGLNYDSQITGGSANYATYSGYYGGFLQDQFRVSRKMTLNLGLRLEYEGGPTERYNRMIGYFDNNAKIFVTDVAEAFYKANPTVQDSTVSGIAMPGLKAQDFKVRGGVTFPGVNGVPRQAFQGQLMLMPRIAFAYALGQRTVIRGGVGHFLRHPQRDQRYAESDRLRPHHDRLDREQLGDDLEDRQSGSGHLAAGRSVSGQPRQRGAIRHLHQRRSGARYAGRAQLLVRRLGDPARAPVPLEIGRAAPDRAERAQRDLHRHLRAGRRRHRGLERGSRPVLVERQLSQQCGGVLPGWRRRESVSPFDQLPNAGDRQPGALRGHERPEFFHQQHRQPGAVAQALPRHDRAHPERRSPGAGADQRRRDDLQPPLLPGPQHQLRLHRNQGPGRQLVSECIRPGSGLARTHLQPSAPPDRDRHVSAPVRPGKALLQTRHRRQDHRPHADSPAPSSFRPAS